MNDNQVGLKVYVDASGAAQGAREFQRSTQDIKDSASGLSGKLTGLKDDFNLLKDHGVQESLEGIHGATELLQQGLELLGLGGIALGLGEVIHQSAELESAFTRLQIVSGTTSDAMKQMALATRGVSDAAGTSQFDVLAIQTEAAARGFKTVADNAAIAKTAIDLAKVTGSGDHPEGAGTLLTSVLQSFQIDASQAQNVSDSLAVTLNKVGISTGQFATEFDRLSPYVRTAGLSLNEFLKTLVDFEAAGIKGRNAIQGTSQLFLAIAQPTTAAVESFKSVSKALAESGIQADSLAKLVGQQGVIGALKTLKSVTDETQFAALVGGTRAAIDALRIMGLTTQQLADTQDLFNNKSKLAKDALEAVEAEAKSAGDTFKNNLNNHLHDLGDAILPVVTAALHAINSNFGLFITVVDAVGVALGIRLVLSTLAAGAAFLRLGTSALASTAEVKLATAALAENTAVQEANTAAKVASLISTDLSIGSALAARGAASSVGSLASTAAGVGVGVGAAAQAIESVGSKALGASVGVRVLAGAFALLGGWPGIIIAGLTAVGVGLYEFIHEADATTQKTKEMHDQILAATGGFAELKKAGDTDLLGKARAEIDATKKALADLRQEHDVGIGVEGNLVELPSRVGTKEESDLTTRLAGQEADAARLQKSLDNPAGVTTDVTNSPTFNPSTPELNGLHIASETLRSKLAETKAQYDKLVAGGVATTDPALKQLQAQADDLTKTLAKVDNLNQSIEKRAANQTRNDTLVAPLIKKFQDQQELPGTLKDIRGGNVSAETAQTLNQPGVKNFVLQDLTEQSIKAQESLSQFSDKLKSLEGKYDPVIAATQKATLAHRDLKDAFTVAGSAADKAALAYGNEQIELTKQKDVIAGRAKQADELALNDAQKATIDLTAKQAEALVPLTAEYNKGKLSITDYTNVLADQAIAKEKLFADNQVQTAGEKAYKDAVEATTATLQKARQQNLSPEQTAAVVAPDVIAQETAARHTDTLAEEVKNLAGTYDPLIAATNKYAEDLAHLNDVQAQASVTNPKLAAQLTQTQPIAQATLRADIDKNLILPDDLKAEITAIDDYDLALTKLNAQLANHVIDAQQYAKGIEAIKEAFAGAADSFNGVQGTITQFAKAGGDAITQYLQKPAEGLRGLYQGLASQIHTISANFVGKQIENLLTEKGAQSSDPAVANQFLAIRKAMGLGPPGSGTPGLGGGNNLTPEQLAQVAAGQPITSTIGNPAFNAQTDVVVGGKGSTSSLFDTQQLNDLGQGVHTLPYSPGGFPTEDLPVLQSGQTFSGGAIAKPTSITANVPSGGASSASAGFSSAAGTMQTAANTMLQAAQNLSSTLVGDTDGAPAGQSLADLVSGTQPGTGPNGAASVITAPSIGQAPSVSSSFFPNPLDHAQVPAGSGTVASPSSVITAPVNSSSVTSSFIGASPSTIYNSNSSVTGSTSSPVILPEPTSQSAVQSVLSPPSSVVSPPTSSIVAPSQEGFAPTVPSASTNASGGGSIFNGDALSQNDLQLAAVGLNALPKNQATTDLKGLFTGGLGLAQLFTQLSKPKLFDNGATGASFNQTDLNNFSSTLPTPTGLSNPIQLPSEVTQAEQTGSDINFTNPLADSSVLADSGADTGFLADAGVSAASDAAAGAVADTAATAADSGLGDLADLLFVADGGRIQSGMPHIVGERGPEMFVPSSHGTVIPNHEINLAGSDTRSSLAKVLSMVNQTSSVGGSHSPLATSTSSLMGLPGANDDHVEGMTAASHYQFAANGGDFETGTQLYVGEQGPELVQFGAPGRVVPNAELEANVTGNVPAPNTNQTATNTNQRGHTINQHFHVQGSPNKQTQDQIAASAQMGLQRANRRNN